MPDDDVIRVARERELFRRLLELGQQEAIEPLLREALALVVEVTGAQQGYLQVQDPHAEDDAPVWWIQHAFSDAELDAVRANLSRGILAEAIAQGSTVRTPSALLDPRFSGRPSVRLNRIEAVLCVPVQSDPPLGALYLQSRQPDAFTTEDVSAAEIFARQLATLADRLLARHRAAVTSDPTRALRQQLHVPGLIGSSPPLAALLRQIALVAPTNTTLLLTGESGTGKSYVARLIHDNGPRANKPFVEVNCAALPEALLESELFGAMPGAHSTATKRQEGRVGAAQHGTLFLDEIAELAIGLQAKLLQFLESRQYYPLGASKPLAADVRIIAASNTDLQRAVQERRFREDLYYRLQVVPLRIPTLAERRTDVAAIAIHCCDMVRERDKLPHMRLSPGALRALEQAPWPGNIRQLANAIEAALVRAADEGVLQVERRHLFPESTATPAAAAPTFQEATRRFQAQFLREVLEAHEWNVADATKQLDIARSHVYNLINALGLERPRP